MISEKDIQEESGLGENLKAVGQIIVGEIETIGGILTADPITQAEGEFNVETGALRQETSEAVGEESDEAQKLNQTE